MRQDLFPWVGSLALAVISAAAVADDAATGVTGPTVYGMLDVAIQHFDEDNPTGAIFETKSYASRFGVKGTSELTDQLTAIYKYELEIDPEENSLNNSNVSNFLKARNQYVGLQCNTMGSVRLGRLDTPLKQSQGKVDIFNDHNGDIKNIMAGENRPGNTLNYLSPKIADLVEIQASLIQGEGDVPAEVNDDGIADYYSISAVYDAEGIYGAVAYDSKVSSTFFTGGPTARANLLRLTGGYTLDKFQLGVLLQQGESDANSDFDQMAGIISGAYTMDAATYKLQLGMSKNEDGSTDVYDAKLYALGVDYAVGKKTTTYAEFSQVRDDNDISEKDITTAGVGIRHIF